MTVDVLADPDGDDTFPFVPRLPDGRLDQSRMPVGIRMQGGIKIDLTPTVRLSDGRLVPITDVVPL